MAELEIVVRARDQLTATLRSMGTAVDRLAQQVRTDEPLPTLAEFKRRERTLLELALERANGKVSGPGGAAELLGVKPTTLTSKLEAFGLRPGRGTGSARGQR